MQVRVLEDSILARLRSRPSHGTIVAYFALFIALGGGALAATGGFVTPAGKIRGCVSQKGKLTVLKRGQTCGAGLTPIVWSQTGPAGPRGKQGPKGEIGPKGDTGPATGPAGGDLTGNYPAPTIKDSLKDAASGIPSLRSLGTGAQQAAAGNDSRLPTQAENDALAGTSGTPSGSNRLVTNSDARLSSWRSTGNAGTSASTNFLGTTDATDLIFRTNNVERMRLASSGGTDLLVQGQIRGGANNASACAFVVSDDACLFDEQNGSLNVRDVTGTTYGTIRTGTVVAAQYSQLSTVRLKKDIQALNRADRRRMLRTLRNLPLFRFRYRREAGGDGPHTGVLAEKAPRAILGPDRRSVNLYDYIGLVVGATKAQAEEISSLHARIRALERRLQPMSPR